MGFDERYYNRLFLMRLFGVLSLVLLGAVGLMIKSDSDRQWKKFQDRFFEWEVVKTRVKYDAAEKAVTENPEYQELQEKIQTVSAQIEKKCPDRSELETRLQAITEKEAVVNQTFRVKTAELDEARFRWEKSRAENARDVQRRAHQYQKKKQEVNRLKRRLDNLSSEKKLIQTKINQCQEELTAVERQKRSLEQKATILKRKLARVDPAEKSLLNEIAQMVRDAPIIDFANPRKKIHQIVLNDIREDLNFARVPRVDRCTTCHLGIDNPDYEDAPQPFRTHPKLELFLSKDSPHSLEEFGCTVCHGGRGRGTDFVSSAHTPADETQAHQWKKKYAWHELHHWDEPMLARPYFEAGCLKCHSGETVIRGAEKLNLGLNLIERAGCYSCHVIDRYSDWPKPGPSLRHLADKATPEWVYRWLSDPPSFRHRTWMPSFFGLENGNDPESRRRSEQEIHAITHFLFARSEPLPKQSVKEWGDPQKGKERVQSLGCMACHRLTPREDDETTRADLLREQGPLLKGLGSKTNRQWLIQWLKDPQRSHPGTRMPNLRLTDKEAADIAAFLLQDKTPRFDAQELPPVNEEILDEIVMSFLVKEKLPVEAKADLARMSQGERLNYAGEKLVAHYGCFSCHDIKGFEQYKPIGTELTEEGSKDIHRLDFGFVDIPHTKAAWFKQKLLHPRSFDRHKVKAPLDKLKMPQFHFSEEEADAIVTALLGMVKYTGDKAVPRTEKHLSLERGQEIVRLWNCQACHVIEGEGGAVQSSVVDWLVEFEGRDRGEAEALVTSFSPPNLVGEGKKVQTPWLIEFLHHPILIRPWLKVRMPTYPFSVKELNELAAYFSALDDQPFPFSEVIPTAFDPEMIEAGRKLFSSEYFGCAQCHIVGDQLPAGSPDSWAPDFALAHKRLKPTWIEEWLTDPQQLLPGTKMPTYFDPSYFENSGPDDILDGDEHRQIKALRDYLMSLRGPSGEETSDSPATKPTVPDSP